MGNWGCRANDYLLKSFSPDLAMEKKSFFFSYFKPRTLLNMQGSYLAPKTPEHADEPF